MYLEAFNRSSKICRIRIDSGKLITLLKVIVSDLHDVLNSRGFETFPKQRINAKIEEVIEKIQGCEARLKA